MTRTALVTGITGFIGGKLAASLIEKDWRVHAIVRPHSDRAGIPPAVTLHTHDGDVQRLTDVVSRCRPDVVFHLASLYLAAHRPDQVVELVESNVAFPAQLAEAMTAAGAYRLVNTGTSWQHFQGSAFDPVNLYAATKQACCDLLRFYQNARGLSVVSLKLFDTFGEGDTRRKLVQLLLETALSGERLALSPGLQVLDLSHVDDVVDAFHDAAGRLMAADGPLDEDFFLSGERLNIRQLVALIESIVGHPVGVDFGAREYREREVMVPAQAGVRPLLPGWVPSRNLRDWITAKLAEMRATPR